MLLVPVTVQQVGLEPAETKSSSLFCEGLENLIHLRCSHPLSCARLLQILECTLKASTEHGEELSEYFGGEEEGMIKSNIGKKENINKASHNMTLKILLEFSSAAMVLIYQGGISMCHAEIDNSEVTKVSLLVPLG